MSCWNHFGSDDWLNVFLVHYLYTISIDQVQRLSYVDQLTFLCIFNNFNMKNNFYIDSMDLLHFEKKKIRVMDLLHFGEKMISFYNKSLKI